MMATIKYLHRLPHEVDMTEFDIYCLLKALEIEKEECEKLEKEAANATSS